MPTLTTNPARIAELDAQIAEADEAGADHYGLNGRRDYHRYAAGADYYKLRWEAGHDWTAENQSPRYEQWLDGFLAEERAEQKRNQRSAA